MRDYVNAVAARDMDVHAYCSERWRREVCRALSGPYVRRLCLSDEKTLLCDFLEYFSFVVYTVERSLEMFGSKCLLVLRVKSWRRRRRRRRIPHHYKPMYCLLLAPSF
jgi:hypothetical protein